MNKNVLKKLRLIFAYTWLMSFVLTVILGIVLAIKTDPGEYFFHLIAFINVGFFTYIVYIHDRLADMRGQLNAQDERIEKFLASRGKDVVDEVKNDGGK